MAKTETTTTPKPAIKEGGRRRMRGRIAGVYGAIGCLLIGAVLCLDDIGRGNFGYGAHLESGDFADRDYKAPFDLTVVDQEATDEHRKAAMEQAPSVYDFNRRGLDELRLRIDRSFSAARQALATTDPDRPADPSAAFVESLGVSELDEALLALLAEKGFGSDEQRDLQALLAPVSGSLMVDELDDFHRQIEKRPTLLHELANDQESRLEDTASVIGLKGARELIDAGGDEVLADRPRADQALLRDLAGSLLEPNLSFNLRATDERRKSIEEGVKKVTIAVRKGEIIVRNGSQLTEEHVRILRGVRRESASSRAWVQLVGTALLLFAVFAGLWRLARGVSNFSTERKDILFLLSLGVITVVGVQVWVFISNAIANSGDYGNWLGQTGSPLHYLMPIAAGAMLVRLVQTAEAAVLFAMVISIVVGLQLDGRVSVAVYAMVGSLFAAASAERVTQRSTLLRAGVKVGLANLAVVAALSLLGDQALSGMTLVSLLAAFFSGCLVGGFASALAPLAESIFGYTTDIKLLELANREQPLLRDLEIRAPGTYHHSMMVGHLAEKAAEAIGANPLLAKVGGYYHDIGKMRRPHFFVENVTIHQGENRHEKLSPSMSARIIQAHVKDGLELGRDHKLVPGIMSAIGEHHGTSVIRFFYEKAKELLDPDKGDTVEEHEYRYPGPKPQTREAGILMLADSVEAASRTLVDSSPARIQQLVQRTTSNYFRDGQLDECSLTLRDLHAIARSFIDTLSAIRHERIDYPVPTDQEGRRIDETIDEGVVERLEPRKKDRSDGVPEKRDDDLKRLGLH